MNVVQARSALGFVLAVICQTALAGNPYKQISDSQYVSTNAKSVKCYYDETLLVLLFPAGEYARPTVYRATKPIYMVLKDLAGQDIKLVLRVRENVIDKASVLSLPSDPGSVRLRDSLASLRTLNENFRDTMFDVFTAW